MSGPPPKPAHLKLLLGNPGHQKIKPEVQPRIEAELPEPPSHVTGYAWDEWYRLGPELFCLRMMTVADWAVFGAYCCAYKVWKTATEKVDEIARRTKADGLVVDGKMGPYARIAAQAARDMVAFAAEFGLSPATRSRIAAGANPPQGPRKFDGLLGGRKK